MKENDIHEFLISPLQKIRIRKTYEGREIYIIDAEGLYGQGKLIAVLNNNDKWCFPDPEWERLFFKLAKMHRNAFVNNMFKPLFMHFEPTGNTNKYLKLKLIKFKRYFIYGK